MQIIKNTIATTHVGTPKAFRNLTVFPLLNGGGTKPNYLTLDEALAQGSAKVTELGEGGHVPQLTFINSCTIPILLLDGEELVGAKQNRILNLTILAPAGKTIIIPVSCVEAGRWRHTSPEFRSAPRTQYAGGRAMKMAQVSESLEHGSRASRQGEVWNSISMMFDRMGHNSPTAAMSDLYEAEAARIEDFVNAFAPEPGQVGAMFAIEGRLVGFDLFDAPETFGKLFGKLLRGYALEAIAELKGRRPAEAYPQASEQDAEALLRSVAEADGSQFPAVGEGEDIRLKGRGINGAALLNREKLVHLAAFSTGNGRHGRVA